MLEKIKMEVDRLLLVLIMKINFPTYFAEIELFFNFETKISLSTSVFIFSITIPKFRKQMFIHFVHKHVET